MNADKHRLKRLIGFAKGCIINRGGAETRKIHTDLNFFLFLLFEIWISWILDIGIYFVVFGFWILDFHQRWKNSTEGGGGWCTAKRNTSFSLKIRYSLN
jgi:hypothetical protein